MSSKLAFFLINNEILFNSCGQILIKKRFIFNLVIKFFRYIPNK